MMNTVVVEKASNSYIYNLNLSVHFISVNIKGS